MKKLQSLLNCIEQEFGYSLTITEEDVISAKESSIFGLQESREQIQERIDRMLRFAFTCLKCQMAVIQPLTRMQEQIDKEIAALKALPDSKPFRGTKP